MPFRHRDFYYGLLLLLFPQDTVEQTGAARVVLCAPVGRVARAHVASEAVRRLDQEWQVPEELCGRDIPVPVHAGTRARWPGPVLAGRGLRQGRESAMPVQQGSGALRDDRRSQHGGLGTAVLLRQKQLPDAVLRPAVGFAAQEVTQPGIPTVDGGQQSDCSFFFFGALTFGDQYTHRWTWTPTLSFFLQVPTLSQWFHDMSPFFPCCLWQEEQAVGCETYRFERRPSQDCVAYQSPYVGEWEKREILKTLPTIYYIHVRIWRFTIIATSPTLIKTNHVLRLNTVIRR